MDVRGTVTKPRARGLAAVGLAAFLTAWGALS